MQSPSTQCRLRSDSGHPLLTPALHALLPAVVLQHTLAHVSWFWKKFWILFHVFSLRFCESANRGCVFSFWLWMGWVLVSRCYVLVSCDGWWDGVSWYGVVGWCGVWWGGVACGGGMLWCGEVWYVVDGVWCGVL